MKSTAWHDALVAAFCVRNGIVDDEAATHIRRALRETERGNENKHAGKDGDGSSSGARKPSTTTSENEALGRSPAMPVAARLPPSPRGPRPATTAANFMSSLALDLGVAPPLGKPLTYCWGLGYFHQLGSAAFKGTDTYSPVLTDFDTGQNVNVESGDTALQRPGIQKNSLEGADIVESLRQRYARCYPATRSVSCGSTFSACIDVHGNLYQWGRCLQEVLPSATRVWDIHKGAVPPISVSGANRKFFDGSKRSSMGTTRGPTPGASSHDRREYLSPILASTYDPPYSPRPSLTMPIRAVQISCGRKHAGMVDSMGRCHTWGCGFFGRLGLGDELSRKRPTWVSALRVPGSVPRSSEGGSWDEMNDNKPMTLAMLRRAPEVANHGVENDETVTRIACGGAHTLVVTSWGRVFAWGFNRVGQCGAGVLPLGQRECDGERRRESNSFKRTEEGLDGLQVFGVSSKGLAASPSRQTPPPPPPRPSQRPPPPPPKPIGSSTASVLTILAPRRIPGLGPPLPPSSKSNLTKAPDPFATVEWGPVKDVAAGRFHSAAVLAGSGRLVTWGSASDGRLGHNGPFEQQQKGGQPVPSGTAALPANRSTSGLVRFTFVPREVLYYRRQLCVLQICLGDRHCVALESVPLVHAREGVSEGNIGGAEASRSKQGKTRVLTWGHGSLGQLGHGSRFERNLAAPKVVAALRRVEVRRIAAGGDCSLAVDIHGRLFAWGDNESGALGLMDEYRKSALPSSNVESADGSRKESASRNKFGLLCQGLNLSCIPVPRPSHVMVSGLLSSQHLFVESGCSYPLLWPLDRVMSMDCGGGHTVAVIRQAQILPKPAQNTASRQMSNRKKVSSQLLSRHSQRPRSIQRSPRGISPPPCPSSPVRRSAVAPPLPESAHPASPTSLSKISMAPPLPPGQAGKDGSGLRATDTKPLDQSIRAPNTERYPRFGAPNSRLVFSQTNQSGSSKVDFNGQRVNKSHHAYRLRALSMCRNNRYNELKHLLEDTEKEGISSRDFADIVDEHGNTLLLVAAQNGLKRICKLLMRHHVGDLDRVNAQGKGVLFYCQLYGHTDLGNYLREKGAKI